MRWRPKLVVRYGRGGAPVSPESTAGHLFAGVIGLVLSAGCLVAAIFGKKPLFLLGLPITAIWLRDAWAWHVASDAERADYRAKRALSTSPLANTLNIGGNRKTGAMLLLLAVAVGAAVLVWQGHHEALPFLLIAVSLFCVVALDVVRSSGNNRKR